MALPNGDLITTVFDPQMAYPVDKRMQVDTLNSRDSISMFIRWEGMTVYVLEDSKIYILQGGRSNEFWKELGTGSGTGGTTFVGQFATADLLPTTGRSAGDYAFVGTGDDFVQYNWDNIANQWVMAEGQTDMASEFFHIGYKTPLRRPVIFPLFPKDVLVQDSGDFVFAPETAVARFIFTGEVTAIRGIEYATADREIKLINRTGSDIILRDKSSGIPNGSGMDFGGTDYVWVNGSEITLKGNGTYWELAPNNQVAFSDHLDSVNAQVSVGSDGLEVITGVYDRYTGDQVQFKEITFTPSIVDGFIYVFFNGKHFKRAVDRINIRSLGAKGDGSTADHSIINLAQSLLSSGGVIHVPSGIWSLGGIVEINNSNIEILCDKGCVFMVSFSNINTSVFKINGNNNILKNAFFTAATGNEYNTAAIFVYGDDNYLENIEIENLRGGIRIYGDRNLGFKIKTTNIRSGKALAFDGATNSIFMNCNLISFPGNNEDGEAYFTGANNCKYINLKVECDGLPLKISRGSTYCEVIDSVLISRLNVGLRIQGSSYNKVVRGYITGNAIGALITYHSVTETFSHYNEINGTEIISAETGIGGTGDFENIGNKLINLKITCDKSFNVTANFHRMEVVDCVINSVQHGSIFGGNNIKYSDNKHTGGGLDIRGGSNNTITNNEFTENIISSITLLRAEINNSEISGNSFKSISTSSVGIFLYGSNNTIQGNKFDELKGHWLRIDSGASGNYIINNTKYGTGGNIRNDSPVGSNIIENTIGVTANRYLTSLIKPLKESSSGNYNLASGDENFYLRFTGGVGNLTVLDSRFNSDQEITGEIEGGAKTLVAGTGVNLRFPEGQGLVAPTGSRFIIKFKSANDALVTIIKPYIHNTVSELITSPFNLTTAPDVSWIKYNIAGDNMFTGSPNDALTWNIEQIKGNSHTVATRLATNRATGDVYSQVYVSSAWQPWVQLSGASTPPDSSTTVKGIIELATQTETNTGTDNVRAVTPATLQGKLDALIISATATLDFPVIAAGDTERLTTTVTGAALLDPVLVSGPTDIYNSNNSEIDGWVSAANTVTVRVRNNGASSIDPGEGQFKIKVFK